MQRLSFRAWLGAILVSGLTGVLATGAEDDHLAKAAQSYREGSQLVKPQADGLIVCEAEEFRITGPGWQARQWGTNYYAATFANSFLSRKAYLGAPEQCDKSVATIEVQVDKPGRYLALVRYEAAYRFETQFRLQIDQNGKTRLDRLYGARNNLKIWAFKEKLKSEVSWSWGAVENVVWEGHDATVELEAGKAKLSLIAVKQPENAARRNVDLVLLTSDIEQVQSRIDKENYLPLDGMLTQSDDVFLKLHNQKDSAAVSLTVPHCTEHSPYWVHIRNWKPKTLTAESGQSTDWVEVGSLLDTLNDGQWTLTAAGKGAMKFDVEFGVKTADGKIESIRRIGNQTGNVNLAYDADTRWSRRIRLADEVLKDLVDYLKQQPIQGVAPKRTLIYGYTFTHRDGDDKYNALVDEFTRLIGATALTVGSRNEIPADGVVRGYIDVRGVPTPKLEEYCQKLKAEGKAERIAVVSLGDEIGLAAPPAGDHAAFRTWLQGGSLKPADVDPGATAWDQVMYSPGADTAKSKPSLFYHSKIYGYRYGIRNLKERTDILRRHLPNAGVGANFSPHHKHLYLGDTHHWISLFREDGMTMPWGEDYIWQVPVGTQQMNSIMLDMFRAGIRGKPGAKIHYYVMPHTPGNTPNSWRRQFYGDLAHGAKVLNLFEFRPVQAAYTENHCSSPEMFQGVRKALHELGQFEDIIQDGQVRPAEAALWFSEAADVWDDNRHPFDAAKRCLYIAVRHTQKPLDFVVEGDDLNAYKVLYLTDQHVSRAASKAIADWVNSGGRLLATAGGGMFDEFNQPNKVLRDLLGVEQMELMEAKDPIRFEKQDLPFAELLDEVTAIAEKANGEKLPVFGARCRAKVTGEVTNRFKDGSPAVASKKVGSGQAVWIGFMPGLSYLQPAIPRRPVDRGSSDDAMAHFMPTKVHAHAAVLLDASGHPPVACMASHVETSVVESKHGTAIALVNWNAEPIKDLNVEVSLKVPTAKVSLASGKPVKTMQQGDKLVFVLDLDVADVLILR